MIDSKTERERFRDDVRNIFARKNNSGIWATVGNPHPVFVQKNMPNMPMKISPAVIRKARKLNYNDHCVKQEDLERLPELLDNPAALLKSLTNSSGFVVVLDAKDDKDRPVILAIEPKNGFNEITSVYGRDNFLDFITRTNEAECVLSLNKKAIENGLMPPIQFRDPTTFDDFQEPVSQTLKKMSSGKFVADENTDRGASEAGFVQGVCECANIVKQKDVSLANNLLKEMGVTQALAQKFASPETYQEMKKDIYAPKLEQKQEQKLGRSM